MDPEALKLKLAAKFGDANARTGGKGSVRRKKKVVHRTQTNDDKKLQSTLKRIGVSNFPAVDEVNMFKNDGTVIHFKNPKVQAAIQAKTYVISGHSENVTIQSLLPDIVTQLGADNLMSLKKLAEAYSKPGAGAAGAADEEMPSLVGTNFEDAANA